MVAMSESSLRRKHRGPSQARHGGGSRSDFGSGGGGAPDEALRLVRVKAADVAGRVISGTREVKEQVMQKAADLTRAVAEGVREEAEKFFDEQKGRLGTKAQRVAKAINQAAHALHAVKADNIADAVDAAAGRVEQAASYIEERGLGDLVADAEDVARRHPGIMLGGLFLTGLVAARFVKASASREDSDEESGGANGGGRGNTSRRGAARHGRNGKVARRG